MVNNLNRGSYGNERPTFLVLDVLSNFTRLEYVMAS